MQPCNFPGHNIVPVVASGVATAFFIAMWIFHTRNIEPGEVETVRGDIIKRTNRTWPVLSIQTNVAQLAFLGWAAFFGTMSFFDITLTLYPTCSKKDLEQLWIDHFIHQNGDAFTILSTAIAVWIILSPGGFGIVRSIPRTRATQLKSDTPQEAGTIGRLIEVPRHSIGSVGIIAAFGAGVLAALAARRRS